MKVFISGPMSGKPNYNRAAFFKAEEELEKHGYSVWNPAWLAYPNDTEFTKDDMHIIDFAAIRLCDAIYMLKGWKYSKGAQEEHEYAAMRGLTIMYEDECFYSFRFNLSKAPKKNTPVFDQEFAYNEAVKNTPTFAFNSFRLNNHADRIGTLEDEVEAIKESIGTDNLQEQLEKDFADVYEEFQNTKDKVNDIEFGYIDWSSKMSSAINEMEKVKDTVKGLNSLVATLGECNRVLSDKLESSIEENRHYRLSVTEQLGTIRSRLKAIDNLENTNEVHWINIQGLDKKLDELIHNVAELEKDQVDINSKVLKKFDDYNEADEALEKRIKDMNVRMSLFARELDTYEEAYKQLRTNLDNNDNALEKRIKAIEKRLNIKPFYAPTEDEKDDD